MSAPRPYLPLSKATIRAVHSLRDTASYAPDIEVLESALHLYRIAERSRRRPPQKRKPSAADGSLRIVVRDRILVIQYSKTLIEALAPVTLSNVIGRNIDASYLLLDAATREEERGYVNKVQELISELKRLNALLEKNRPKHSKLAPIISSLERGFDEFLKSYAKKMGTIAAVATALAAGQLLYNVGYGKEIVELFWSYLRKPE